MNFPFRLSISLDSPMSFLILYKLSNGERLNWTNMSLSD